MTTPNPESQLMCKDCAWFELTKPDQKPPLGLCHRYPPPNEGGEFPPVWTTDWCGEFEPCLGKDS